MITEPTSTPQLRARVERLYAALAVGDETVIEALLTTDFVGRVTPGLPFGIGGEHHGAAAMIREVWFTIGKHWRVRPVPESFSRLEDDRLHVTGVYQGRSRVAGAPVDAWFAHDFTFRGDLISGLTQVTDSIAFVDALADEAPLTSVGLTVADGVATLCLNRPDARNAIDQQLADELLVAALRIARDGSVRAVLVCGDGTDLTVGGDIAAFARPGREGPADLGHTLRQMVTPFHLALEVLAGLDVPIVTVAHGSVVGGGLGLVYAADLVVAAEDTRFLTAFAALGLSGDGGGTWHLPRRIGPARAARAYLANEPITAAEGLDWGLVNEVVPTDEARTRGAELARGLADGPTRAFAQMRALLRQSWDRSLPEQLHAEIEALAATGRTDDARAAVEAFLVRRRPAFEGK